MDSKPNIIWIISDDTSQAMLGYNGGQALSPNIDSIAHSGIIFDQFHCVSPACTPSRYNYLTGHYGGRCPSELFWAEQQQAEPYKVYFNTVLDPRQEMSVGHALQQAGYRTGFVGKWHVAASREDQAALPRFVLEEDPQDPATAKKMAAHQEQMCAIVRKAGFDYAHSVVWGNYETLPMRARNHNIEWITKGALDFIDASAETGAPFFLSMATTTIHGPNHVSSLLADPHLTAAGYSDEHVGCQASRQSIYERISQADGIAFNSTTAGVLWMDDAVGAVLNRLRALGIEQDTVVIFSTDHGPSIGGKFTAYQRGTRIPFALQWKGKLRGGRVVKELAQNVDLLPTLLDLAGAAVPAGMVLDGRSLRPLLTGDQATRPGRDDLYFEFGHTRAVRTKKWKYLAWRLPESVLARMRNGEIKTHYTHFGRPIVPDIVDPGLLTASLLKYPHYFDPDQLYDLERDPQEQNNLAGHPEFQAVLDEMKGRLRKYLKTLKGPFPLDTPDPFCGSKQYEELKRVVRNRVTKEEQPLADNYRFIGFDIADEVGTT